MKTLATVLVVLGGAILSAAASEPQAETRPVWELNASSFTAVAKVGSIELTDGVVKIDGSNSFALPTSVLGEQCDYTIEFEIRRPANTVPRQPIQLVANTDDANQTGLGITYFPPAFNAIRLFVNGHKVLEQKTFLGDDFDKITLVAKNRKLTVFRNGLILAVTGEVKPSSQPLTFGGIAKERTPPYELKAVKIYDLAIYPTGFDASAERMSNHGGDEYFMQRVEIKDPTLPRILVVGASTSMGYREFITEHFKGRAYVDYWVGGGWMDPNIVKGENSPVKRGWNGVLLNGPYDVVTWNAMTIHMWHPDNPERCPEVSYPGNMTDVVEHLQKTAPQTKFIWIRCTPFTKPIEGQPSLMDGEKNPRIIKFNAVTDAIMAQHGIPEVDLFAICEQNLDKALKDGVHWNKAASRLMADAIIQEIEKDFPKTHLEK